MGTLVAINAQDLYYSARRAGGEVDYKRLWNFIQRREPEFMSVVYLVRTPSHDSAAFESLLKGFGYRLSTRMAVRTTDDEGRRRLRYASHDIRISLEASVKYLDQYEKFVLVSGDEDFSDLFAFLKSKGKATELWSYHRELHPIIVQSVDKTACLVDEALQVGR
jgi:uncharacterized LabA/DUF88 family protein